MSNYDYGFIAVPSIVAKDRTLSANAKLICGIVNSFGKKNPKVFAKNEYYAEFLGIKSTSTVSRHITELVNKGYLHRFIKYRVKQGIETKEIESRFLWVSAKVKETPEEVYSYWNSHEGKRKYESVVIKDLKKIWED